MMNFNRRQFLQAAGLGGASFFLPSLTRGQSGEPPMRFVMICTELGPEINSFRMKPPGAPDSVLTGSSYDPQYYRLPDEAEWSFDLTGVAREDFSYALEPLYDLREHVLAFEGLCLATTGLDDFGDGHAKGFLAASTGAPAAYALSGQQSHASAPSLDRRIGRWLRQQDPSLSDLASLNYRVFRWGYGEEASTEGFHYFFYDQEPGGEIVRVPVEQDPRAAFDRLFPNPSDTGTDPVAARQVDVLNVLTERYAAVNPRLSTADRQKLDQHRQNILDLQRRLQAQQAVNCIPPPRFQREPGYPPPAVTYQPSVDAFTDLIVAALACGLTRTVGFQLPHPPPTLVGGTEGADYHQVYSHGADPTYAFSEPGSSALQQWTAASAVQRNKSRREAEIVAALASRLRDIPEGDGTMLDNTVILWIDEISHGGHGHDQWPAVVVGGSRRLRTGRYIRYPRVNPRPARWQWTAEFVGQPASALHVSMCQAMGMDIEHFGVPEIEGRVSEGPRRGETGTLSLRGPLPGILA